MHYSYILLCIELCTVAIVTGIGRWGFRSHRGSGTRDGAENPGAGVAHVRRHVQRMSVD